MAKKFHRLAGAIRRADDLPTIEQARMRDLLFTSAILQVSTLSQLERLRASYTEPELIAEYGAEHCNAIIEMIDGHLALRSMKLTHNVSRMSDRRRRRDR